MRGYDSCNSSYITNNSYLLISLLQNLNAVCDLAENDGLRPGLYPGKAKFTVLTVGVETTRVCWIGIPTSSWRYSLSCCLFSNNLYIVFAAVSDFAILSSFSYWLLILKVYISIACDLPQKAMFLFCRSYRYQRSKFSTK